MEMEWGCGVGGRWDVFGCGRTIRVAKEQYQEYQMAMTKRSHPKN